MTPLSRRTFLHGIATSPLLLAALRAQPRTIVTRHEARTTEGVAMLAKYAKAVAIMKDPMQTMPGNPVSWRFQWYTHWTPTDKDALLLELYPMGQPMAWRSVAQKTWDTCQAHFQAASRQPFFLPWHRWYLYFFESIVREVLQDQTFALPYWDYTLDATLPPEFRKRGDATFGALFNEARFDAVNTGDPIVDAEDLAKWQHDALCAGRYGFRSTTEPGFCRHIDGNLHGNVHGAIGGDMGIVPTAANDPIFWLHHCNIDRMWQSWNASGFSNPGDAAFKNERFTFADARGMAVTKTAGACYVTDDLGYKYDRLTARPADCPASRESVTPPVVVSRATAVSLGAGETRVALAPRATRETLRAGRDFLVLSGLTAPAAPGTLYHVYLNLPANASAEDRRARRVGFINFFDLSAHEKHQPRRDRSFAFDVTDVLRASGGSATPSVSIVPRNAVNANVRPTVAEVQIVRQ